MKKLTKSLVAMLALVAMLTQNAYGVYAAATSPQPILADEEMAEPANPEIEVVTEDTTDDGNTEEETSLESEEEGTPVEYVDGDVDVEETEPTDDVNYDDEVMPLDEEVEEVDESIPEELDIYGNQISGSGLDELEVYVDTERLNSGDSFRIVFVGADDAQYDTRLNDNLDATSQGIYRFTNLNKEGFNIRATSDDEVSFAFTSNNGRPVIEVISDEEEIVKVIERKSITLKDGSPVTAISGEGFENVYVDFDTENLAKDLKFSFVIETEADVTVNGESYNGKIKGLDNDATSMSIADLNGEEFVMYVEPAGADFITSEIVEISENDGAVTIEVAGEETRIKRVYTYDDDQVSVTATLSDPKAVPDDADFVVTPITAQKAVDAYLEALNRNSDEETEYTEENTILLDIAFLVDKKDEEGNVIPGEKVEFEPEVGTVKIEINYKKSQLTGELGATENEDVEIKHLPLSDSVLDTVDTTAEATNISANDIKVEDVRAEVTVTENGVDIVEFVTDSLSVYASWVNGKLKATPGTNYTYKQILGEAVNYGITANELKVSSHMDTNFATGKLTGSAQLTGGAFTGNGNPGDIIVAEYPVGNSGFWTSCKKPFILYTTEDAASRMNTANMLGNCPDMEINTDSSESELKQLVRGMVSGTLSSAMASDNATIMNWLPEGVTTSDKEFTLDLTDKSYAAGTYYFGFNNGEFAKSVAQRFGRFTLKIRSNQRVVFNIPDSDVYVGKFNISIDGNQVGSDANTSGADPYTESVVFNCPNATHLKVDAALGIFLAPNADAEIATTSTGWLVCNRLTYNAGEWHGVWQEQPESEINTAKVTFHVKKTLVNNTSENKPFTFELYSTGDKYFADNGTGTLLGTLTINSYENNIGYGSFDYIEKYDSDADRGYHYYVIKEIKDSEWDADHGYSYIRVKVGKETKTVANKTITRYKVESIEESSQLIDNTNDRRLKDARTIQGTNPEVSFTNTKTTKQGTSLHITATKKFAVDGTWPEGKKFQFKLEGLDNSYDKVGHISGKAPLPNYVKDPIILTVDKDHPVADFGYVDFEYDPSVAEKTVGTTWKWGGDMANNYPDKAPGGKFRAYLWRITEIMPDGATAENNYTVDGIKYDPTAHYIKIFLNQVYNKQGGYRLVCEMKESTSNDIGTCYGIQDMPVFTNDVVYETVISGNKEVLPRKIGLNANDYSFVIVKGAGSPNPTPMPKTTTVGNDANGNFSFPAIKYSTSDIGKTFKYEIYEQPGANSAMHYSTERYEVAVTVNANGVTKTVKKVGSTAVASADTPVKFVNRLSAYGEQTFTAKKSYNLPLEGGEFKFKLEKENADNTRTVLEKDVLNGSDAQNGIVNFTTVEKYSEQDIDKTYVYYVSEIIPENKNGITYDAKEYKYTVSIKDGGANADVVNNKAKLNIDTKIEVSNSNGGFSPYSGTPVFTNTYASKGEGTITVRKNTGEGISAETLATKEFTFKVTRTDADHNALMDGQNYKYSKEKTVTGPGTAVFGGTETDKIAFEGAGNYYFTVQEVNIPSGATADNNYTFEGITYDPTPKYVTLEVIDDNKGNLVVNKQYVGETEGSVVEVTNTYNVKSVDVTIDGIKELVGKDLTEGAYEFTITAASNAAPMPEETTVSNNGAGYFEFGPITYTEAGEYTYTVREGEKTEVGVTNDTSVYTVKVTVRDNGAGQLVASKQYKVSNETKEALKFRNTYNANGTATVEVHKTLSSTVKTIKANEFEFELTDANHNRIGSTVFNDENGDASFEAIRYSLSQLDEQPSKTFTYYVREIVPEKKVDGYTYDGTYHQVNITVTNNTTTGKLDTSIEYVDSTINKVAVTNSYDAMGETTVDGTKAMIGRKIGKDEVIAVKLVPVSAVDKNGETISDPNPEQTAYVVRDLLDHKSGSFEFDKKLTYTAVGTYVYNVFEVKGDAAGTNYDETIYTLTVSVDDASITDQVNGYGKLICTKSYSVGNTSKSGIAFVNECNAKNEFTPKATKSYVTKDGQEAIALKGNDFTFIITDEKGDHEYKNDSEGLVVFGTYEYEEAGTHEYFVTEKQGNNSNVTYDGAKYKIVVEVEETESSELSVSDTYYKLDAQGNWQALNDKNEVTFKNEYEAEGSVTFNAFKVINDSTGEKSSTILPLEGEFSFDLYENGTKIASAVNDASGKVTFARTYTEKDLKGDKTADGKYIKYYTIKEDRSNPKPGFSYSSQEYIVAVSLKDNGKGVIETECNIINPETQPEKKNALIEWFKNLFNIDVTVAEFVNEYDAYGEVEVTGHKTLTGGKALEDGMFGFSLTGDGVSLSARNIGDTVTFAPIKYTTKDIGTHVYTVTETQESLPGIRYSQATYTVTVTVADAVRDGVLEVTAVVSGSASMNGDFTIENKTLDDGETHDVGVNRVGPLPFINDYIPSPTTINVGGMKTMSGLSGNMKLADYEGKFEFVMVNDAEKGNTKEYSSTKTMANNGSFLFDEIQFTQEDLAVKDAEGNVTGYLASKEFVYKVTETTGTLEGIDYDSSEKEVIIVLTDNKNGTLSAVVKGKTDSTNAVSFANTYVSEGELVVNVTKETPGANDNTKVFRFTMTGPSVNSELSLKGGETDAFSTVRFTLDQVKAAGGKYTATYEIAEDQTNPHPGYTYCNDVHTVKVEVTQDPADPTKLKIDKWVDGEAANGAIGFTYENPYAAEGQTSITGKKILSGAANLLSENMFEFVLSGGKLGDTVLTAPNDANGEFGFDITGFTAADAGKSFTYKLREKTPERDGIVGIPNVSYSDTEYDIVVQVVDNGDGTLKVTATPDSLNTIVFTNTYEDEDTVTFKALKEVEKHQVDSIFKFKLHEIKGGKLKDDEIVTNSGRDVVFNTVLKFDQNDVGKEFKYVISETELNKYDPYTYDTNKFYAKVDVAIINNELTATRKYYSDEACTVEIDEDDVKFVNKYNSNAEAVFGGTKFLKGTDKGTYKFVLTDSQGNELRKASVAGRGAYTFPKLEYSQDDMYVDGAYVSERTFNYIVKEIDDRTDAEKKNGIEYDKTVYRAKVVLKYDDETKKLVATKYAEFDNGQAVSSVKPDALDFTNKFEAEGYKSLTGTKEIVGKNLEENKYQFGLFINGEKVTDVPNEGGSFTFLAGENSSVKWFKYNQDDLKDSDGKYKDSVDFTYEVREIESRDGSEIDTTVYTVVDTVSIKNGKLDIDRKVTKPDENGKPVVVSNNNSTGIVFVNKYHADGEIVLEGTKYMLNKDLIDDEFTFVIKDASGNVLADENGNKYEVKTRETKVDPKTNIATFEFKFPAIKYTQEDLKEGTTYSDSKTIHYTVVETGSLQGVKNGGEVYSVDVTIKDSGKKDFKLDVTKVVKRIDKSEESKLGFIEKLINAKKDVDIEFTNTYDANGVWDPEGTKALTGREFGNNEFQFAISELDAPKGEVINDRTATVPNQGTKVKFDHNNVSWLNYSIEDIGKHYYKVRELDPGVKDDLKAGAIDNGWADTYDKSVFEYTIDVQDDGQGHLTPNVELVSVYDGNGKLIGTHTGGMFKFNFTNEYEAKGSVDLHATKNVTGRDLGNDQYDFTIQEVKAGNVVNTAVVQNNGNAIDFLSEKISFLNYTRDDLGSHEYIIKENDLDAKYADLKKDDNVYRVTVSVADKMVDGKPVYDGNLDVKVVKVEQQLSATEGTWKKLDGAPQLDSLFSFNNTYNAKAAIDFIGTKHLRRAELATEDIKSSAELAGRYEFAVYQYTNSNRTGDRVEVNKAGCDGDGNYILRGPSFDETTLKEATGYADSKTFYYQIVEVKPTEGKWDNGKFISKRGVTYDNTVYNIDVTVKPAPKGSNNLIIEVKDADKGTVINATPNTDNLYTIGGSGYFDFVNIKPDNTEIRGEKIWQDKVTDKSTRPDVTIELRSSEDDFKSVIDTYVIHATDASQEYVFRNLPATDKFGKTIEYRTTEVAIPGYVSEKVGNNFVNTKGEIVIRKINSITGAPVEGAVLAILSDGTEIERWTTSSSAHIVGATLEKGRTYTLREISAPEGYAVAADMTFTVPTDGGDIVVVMEDVPVTGAVRLRKLDSETRATLSGAEFALYTEDGIRVYAAGTPGSYRYSTSASNGRFAVNSAGELEITELPYGTYYFTEIVAPSGYRLSTERVSFSILRDKETIDVTFLNTKELGSVRLRKANADGSRSLAGAVFELYAKTPSSISSAIASTIYRDAYYRVGTYTTDDAGMIYVGDLPWDDYYFVEVSAPSGYTVNTDTNGDVLVYT
ncbi:MAG: FctA domain-containing protein, partial [Lachnospiraceae bacterium]|nr:FctA domain-containing protein [Lachnospiraceae bacterium]